MGDPLGFRLSRIKEIEDYCIAEINNRETMSKTLDYASKILLVLEIISSDVSLRSFTTVIDMPVGIARTSISLVFLISFEIVKMILTVRNEKNKLRKIALLPRNKLNSIEKIIFKPLLDSSISHDEFMIVINEQQNYFGLKESTRAKKDQLDNTEHESVMSIEIIRQC